MNTTNIWENFSENILHFIQQKVSNPEDALDIRQDVFLKVHLKSAQIRRSDKILAWVYQITRNSIQDYYRQQYKTDEEVINWAMQMPQKEYTNLEKQELYCCLKPFVDELPKKYKIVMTLHHQEGKSQNEIAKHLGISVSGVKSRIQRARELLKNKFATCCGYHISEKGHLKGEQDCKRCNTVHHS